MTVIAEKIGLAAFVGVKKCASQVESE